MKRRLRVGLSLIERAVIERQVRDTFKAAKRNVADSEDSDAIVNKSGRMFYIVLGAAIADGMDPDLPDIRILRGACNAMYDQKGELEIPESRRAAIASGLQACWRLMQELDYDSVVREAFALEIALKEGKNVDWSHFQARLGRLVA